MAICGSVRLVWVLIDDAEMGCFLGARGVCCLGGGVDDVGGCARRSYEAGQDRGLSQLWPYLCSYSTMRRQSSYRPVGT